MKIKALYEKYDIMPQLALHQLRVGGIAKIVTNGWQDRAIAKECIIACLVHDMGNIIKFTGLSDPYWIEVQQRYIAEYGTDAHEATYAILKKEKLDRFVHYLLDEASMYTSRDAAPDFANLGKPALVVLYGDLRVAMNGVVSMGERIDDLVKRYGGERVESQWSNQLEKYIQTLAHTDVVSITEETVTPFFDELLTYDI